MPTYWKCFECTRDAWSTISFDSMFSLNSDERTRGYTAKITKNRCRLDLRRHFFCERVVDRWNRLDQRIIDSTSINASRTVSIEQELHRSAFSQLIVRQAVGHIFSGLRYQVRPHLVCTWYVLDLTMTLCHSWLI